MTTYLLTNRNSLTWKILEHHARCHKNLLIVPCECHYYESLRRNCPNFRLFVFPFDSKSDRILQELKLSNVSIVSMSDFENNELLRIKASRTKGEYCWTCTPSIIWYCIDNFNLNHCTYI